MRVSMRAYAPTVRVLRKVMEIEQTRASGQESSFLDQCHRVAVKLAFGITKGNGGLAGEICKPIIAVYDLIPSLLCW